MLKHLLALLIPFLMVTPQLNAVNSCNNSYIVYDYTVADDNGANSGAISLQIASINLDEVLAGVATPSYMVNHPNVDANDIVWSGPGGFAASGYSITGLASGLYYAEIEVDCGGYTYDVVITVGVGCTGATAPIITDIIKTACKESANAYIELSNASTGVTWSYEWTGITTNFTASTKDIYSLVPGIYQLDVSNGSCSYTYTYQVDYSSYFTVQHTTTEACEPFSGAINLTVAGTYNPSQSPYKYEWSGPNGYFSTTNSSSIAGLQPCNYIVTITDRNGLGCSQTLEVMVPGRSDQPDLLYKNQTPSCYKKDGEINVQLQNPSIFCGYDLVRYNLYTEDGAGSRRLISSKYLSGENLGDPLNFTDITTGKYILEMVYGGCKYEEEILFCCEGDLYLDYEDIGCGVMAHLKSNVYGSAANIPGIQSIEWIEYILPYTGHYLAPPGTKAVSAQVLPEFQLPPNYPIWLRIAGVVVQFENGCSEALIIKVPSRIEPTSPIELNYTVTNPTCAGSNDGILNFNITGGTPPYTVTFSSVVLPTAVTRQVGSGSNSLIFEAGDYYVAIKDAVGTCTTFDVFQMVAPAPSAIGYTIKKSCYGRNDGSITVTSLGGSPLPTSNVTYTLHQYVTQNGGSYWVQGVTQTSPIFSNLTQGNYKVEVVTTFSSSPNTGNQYNCISETSMFWLGTESPVTGTVAVVPTCSGSSNGMLTFTPTSSGFYTYTWGSNGTYGTSHTNPYTGVAAGSYAVTVVNTATGCPYRTSGMLPTVAPFSINGKAYNSCGTSNGKIDLTVNGGKPTYSFSWSNGSTSQNVTGLVPGSYSVTATDGCGTTATASFTVAQVDMSIFVDVVDAGCGNNLGSASIRLYSAGTNATIEWFASGGTNPIGRGNNVNGLPPGDYVVEVTDASGCFADEEFTVEQLDGVEIVSIVQGSPSCNYTVTVQNGTAPYVLSWQQLDVATSTYVTIKQTTSNTNTSTVYNLPAGSYKVVVTDANGCSDVSSQPAFTVVASTTPTLTEIYFRWNGAGAPPVCADCEESTPYTPGGITIETINEAVSSQLSACTQQMYEELEESFGNGCLGLESIDDQLTVAYELYYYHYTLYYHDRAGNLVRTVPPQGVGPNPNATDRTTHDPHEYETKYWYNNWGQLVQQKTPDGGLSHFKYNALGQLRFSQNEQQYIDNKFSYTHYDALGRIIEVGEANLWEYNASMSTSLTFDDFDADNMAFPEDICDCKRDRTITVYTEPASGIHLSGKPQRFLNNRVSYVYTDEEDINNTSDRNYTYYSYDPHGNVEWLIQDLHRFTKNYMRYEYELISGNVLKVFYNEGRPDQLFIKYSYDENNRLTEAFTSRDGVIWDKDAKYQYYTHSGALQRMELGQDKVQGIDYAYTIHGWLKGINSYTGNPTNDLGADGATGSLFNPDAYSMALGYYENDFKHSSIDQWNATNTAIASVNSSQYTNLYNGNISWWINNAPNERIGDYGFDYKQSLSQYKYDHLNRLKEHRMTDWDAVSGSWNTFGSNFATGYTYDQNGNILSLSRSDGAGTQFDQLNYFYYGNGTSDPTNKLAYVTDGITNTALLNNDIENQNPDNYEYDAIGNLTKDEAEGIDEINWTPYGKIRSITKTDGTELEFTYDAMGQRIRKVVKPTTDPTTWLTTFYVRDATGNVMGVYDVTIATAPGAGNYLATYKLSELPIYGSSRLGQYQYENNIIHEEVLNASQGNNIRIDLSATTNTGALANWIYPVRNVQHGYTSLFQWENDGTDFTLSRLSTSNNETTTNGIAIGEDLQGNLKIYSITSNTGNGTIVRVYDGSHNLLNSVPILSDMDAQPVWVQHPGNADIWYFITTYQGQTQYSYYDFSTGNGDANLPFNTDAGKGHHFALVQDGLQKKAWLYQTQYDATAKTRSLLVYVIDEAGIANNMPYTTLATFSSVDDKGYGEIQVSTKTDKLLVYDFTSQGALGSMQCQVKVYDLRSDRMAVTGPTVIGPFTNEYSTRTSADFSDDGLYVFYNTKDASSNSEVRRHELATGTDVQAMALNSGTGGQLCDIRRSKQERTVYVLMDGYPKACTGSRCVANENSKIYKLEYLANGTLNAAVTNNANHLSATGIYMPPPLCGCTTYVNYTSRSYGYLPSQPVKIGGNAPTEAIYARNLRNKYYELTDHLGNVRVVLSDLRLAYYDDVAEETVYANNDITTSSWYYPFGWNLPGRGFTSSLRYRHGFQGQETDPEYLDGAVSYKYRVHDSRIGRFLSIDPLTPEYPWNSPYAFSENRVTDAIELEGLESFTLNDGSEVNGPYSPEAIKEMNCNLGVVNMTITYGVTLNTGSRKDRFDDEVTATNPTVTSYNQTDIGSPSKFNVTILIPDRYSYYGEEMLVTSYSTFTFSSNSLEGAFDPSNWTTSDKDNWKNVLIDGMELGANLGSMQYAAYGGASFWMRSSLKSSLTRQAKLPNGKTQMDPRGVQSLKKKIDRGNPNYKGLKPTIQTAEGIIDEVFDPSINTNMVVSKPFLGRVGLNTPPQLKIDVFNPITGRGVRINLSDYSVDTFLDYTIKTK